MTTKKPPTCIADEGCNKTTIYAKGLCTNHYQMQLKYGRTRKIVDRGCGYSITNGYIYIRVGERKIAEHVYIAEKALGHSLPKGAVVHHINGVKHDNRPENLVICPNQDYHLALHRRMKELGYEK